jgi:hypothetical protein
MIKEVTCMHKNVTMKPISVWLIDTNEIKKITAKIQKVIMIKMDSKLKMK